MKKKISAWFLILVLCVTLIPQNTFAAVKKISISYSGSMEEYGNLKKVKNGITLGEIGSKKRLESIKITSSATLMYKAYVQATGWQKWRKNGQLAGTTGKSRRLEAIQVKLTGKYASRYDVYYRMHVSEGDWLGWAKNGETAGTTGYGSKIDGIQMMIVAKGAAAPGDTKTPYLNSKVVGDITYTGLFGGKTKQSKNGATLGQAGKTLETVKLNIKKSAIQGGLSYRVYVNGNSWQSFKKQGQTAGIAGKQMEAIEISLTGDLARYYDVYYRTHLQDYGWLDWTKNGTTAGNIGLSKRIEAIQVKLVAKSGKAPGKTEKPYVTTVFQHTTKDRFVSGIGEVDLWLGDSRMVGFGNIIYGHKGSQEVIASNMVAKVSSGYSWINTTGFNYVKQILDRKPDAIVVSNYGLNDIYNYENYLSFYKRLHAMYPKAKICVMSVNPIGTGFRYSNNYGFMEFTKNIAEFNSFMKRHVVDFDGYYIDTYNEVCPVTVSDGIHYSRDVYWDLYHYVTGK